MSTTDHWRSTWDDYGGKVNPAKKSTCEHWQQAIFLWQQQQTLCTYGLISCWNQVCLWHFLNSDGQSFHQKDAGIVCRQLNTYLLGWECIYRQTFSVTGVSPNKSTKLFTSPMKRKPIGGINISQTTFYQYTLLLYGIDATHNSQLDLNMHFLAIY
jgi:hypothetical protein